MHMYNPPHPGTVLADSFDEDFTVDDAARQVGIPVQMLTDIMNGTAPITREIAFLLAIIFPGDQPRTWLNLQADYDAWQATTNLAWQTQVLAQHQLSPDLLEGLGPWQ